MQLKTFIKDLAFVQVVNFLVKPLWILLVDRAVQNQLGEEVYGAYYAAFALASMLYIISDLGLNNYLTKSAFENEKLGASLILNSVKIKLMLSLVFFGLVIYVGYKQQTDIKVLAWVAINQVLLSFSQYLRVWFNVDHQFRKESIIGVLDRLVAIVIFILVFYGLSLDGNEILFWFLGVQSIGYLVAISVALFYIFNRVNRNLPSETIQLKEIILACFPFTLLAFFMALFTRINVPLMGFLIPDNPAFHQGVYAQGDVILNAGNMMAAIVGAMLLPIFSKLIKEHKPLWPIVKLSIAILGGSALLVALILWTLDSQIYQVYYQSNPLFSSDFDYKLATFSTVIKGYIPMALIYVFGTYLTALGKLKYLVWCSIITLIFNLVLNVWLQPQFFAYGAAIAALLSQTLFCVLCIVLALKHLRHSK